jgi:hypothetical protein
MHTPRTAELCHEGGDTWVHLKDHLEEFITANACGGCGIARDPAVVWLEIQDDVHALGSIMRELRDELEREVRGMRP